MSKLGCRCGAIMRITVDVSDYGYLLVPDENIITIADILENTNGMHPDVFFDKINKGGINVLRCPSCGRLWLENEDRTFTSYVQEDAQKSHKNNMQEASSQIAREELETEKSGFSKPKWRIFGFEKSK